VSSGGAASRQRLLTVTPDFPPAHGGIQLLLARLVEQFSQFEIEVVTRGATGPSPSFGPSVDVVRTRASTGPQSIVALNARALRAGLANRPSVILSGHVFLSPATAALRRLCGAPTVTYLHADEVPARPSLTRLALRTSAAVIAVSSFTRELALQFGADPQRLQIIPPGVDVPEAPLAGREREQRPTLVTVARLADTYKGHDMVLRAMPRILERVPSAQWVVIGDGPLRPKLEAQVRESRLEGAVRFLGSVADCERDAWLERAHVFVLVSRLQPSGTGGEGFGIVYLEAAARGLPSVAGNIGGAVDAVVAGETGLLVDATDPRAVADAVVQLLSDTSLSERLGRSGRLRAESYAWTQIAPRVENLLLEVARRRT
jgi:phosphatidylinositol alpha-1,6-mannosyltransferase